MVSHFKNSCHDRTLEAQLEHSCPMSNYEIYYKYIENIRRESLQLLLDKYAQFHIQPRTNLNQAKNIYRAKEISRISLDMQPSNQILSGNCGSDFIGVKLVCGLTF